MGVTQHVLTVPFEHPHATDHTPVPGWSSILHHHGGVIWAVRESERPQREPAAGAFWRGDQWMEKVDNW